MKSRRVPRKLKGTVLYTVISVMMVLIVFLLGTLALAATANNRAKKNFSTAQTQATAKAGVHAIMASMQNDSTIAQAAYLLRDGMELNVGNIEFDDASLGRIESAKIEYAGKKYIYDYDSTSDTYCQMVAKDVLRLSATAVQGDARSTVSVYLMKDANITDPPPEGNQTAFMSTGGASMDNHSSAFGGTYLGFADEYRDPNYIPTTRQEFSVTNGESFETNAQINGNFTVNNGPMTLVIKAPGTGFAVWGDLTLNKELYVKQAEGYHNGNSNHYRLDGLNTPVRLNTQYYTQIPYIYVDGTFDIKLDNITVGNTGIPLNVYCGELTMTGNNGKGICANIYCFDPTGTSYFGKTSNVKSTLYKWTATQIKGKNGTVDTWTGGDFYTKGNLINNSGESVINGDCGVDGNMEVNGNLHIKGDLKVAGSLNVAGTLTVDGTAYCDNTNFAAAVPLNANTVRELKTGYTTEEREAEYARDLPGGFKGWLRAGWTTSTYSSYIVQEAGPDERLSQRTNADGDLEYYYDGGAYNGQTFPGPIPTYTVYIRTSDNAEVDASEATNVVDAVTHLPVSASVYPPEYEKDALIGTNTDTKVLNTVSEVLNASESDPYQIENTVNTAMTAYGTEMSSHTITLGQADVPGYYRSVADGYEISGNCTVSGSMDGKTLHFRAPTGGTIWVKVTGMTCANNCQWIVDDTTSGYGGVVNIVLAGDVSFTGNNKLGTVTTATIQTLFDNGQTFQIATEDGFKLVDHSNLSDPTDPTTAAPIYPLVDTVNLNIYDDANEHTLTFQNSCWIAANVKAPYLTYNISSGGKADGRVPKIYYNGFDVQADANTKDLGCIGCCIVKEFYSQNNWVLLYVGHASGGGAPGLNEDAMMKCWSVLYYENY
ncbi:MAG: hypothetical protein IJ055_00545 [Oscillospiraceae bacterium]|nr:hypothetical protein [Oscillospiraceae bacterium]